MGAPARVPTCGLLQEPSEPEEFGRVERDSGGLVDLREPAQFHFSAPSRIGLDELVYESVWVVTFRHFQNDRTDGGFEPNPRVVRVGVVNDLRSCPVANQGQEICDRPGLDGKRVEGGILPTAHPPDDSVGNLDFHAFPFVGPLRFPGVASPGGPGV